MTELPSAIQATFHNFKPVLGRKQIQLIFEVPMEHMQTVLQFLGPPSSDGANWFAIARLQHETRELDSLGE